MKKRIFALSMALLMLVSSVFVLASCADKDTDKTPSSTESELEHLKGLDFGGMDINFIVAESTQSAEDFNIRSVYVDEEAADDAVNIALYERNQRVQDLLGVNIVLIDSFHDGIKAKIGTQLQAGVDDYDIIAGRQWSDTQLAIDGVLLDLTTLDMYGAGDYLKWDQEYWATSYIDTLSFGEKVFWVTGDLCMRYSGGFYCFFANTNLYQDLLYEEYGSIYDIVNRGEWTYDKLIEMISKCYKDENGDDKIDLDDRLGMIFSAWDTVDGMAIAAGVMFTRYDNGTPVNNITAGNSTLISFMNKCSELINTTGVYTYNKEVYAEAMGHFAAGKSMFIVGRVGFAELYLRDMQDDYYIIPCPKLNESQPDYYTSVHDAMGIYGINHSIDDEHIQAAAATLEAMAYYSYKDVRPVYYDSFLKFKYTRDDEAWKMIDLMHDSVYTDFVYIWKNSVGDLHEFLRNNVIKSNPTSQIKKNVQSWNAALENILESIEEMEIN